MYNAFMSTCFVLTLSCLRADFCVGWVNGLLWGCVEGVPMGVVEFLLNLQAVESSAGAFHSFCRGRLFAWFLYGPILKRERVNCNLKTNP